VPKRPHKKSCDKPVSLLVLEGDTEEVFYSIVQDKFLRDIRFKRTNIKGQGNVNKDMLGEIFKYTYNNRSDLVRTYCCVDTEGQKRSATPFDLALVHEHIQARQMKCVLSVGAILADPDIESWVFFLIYCIKKLRWARK